MAKKRDDTEVLKAIIAKSINKTAVAVAQSELSSLQERKAAVSAAIKPVLDVPQIVAQPTSATASEALTGQTRKRGGVQKDDDVVKNIRKMREDIGRLAKDSAESKKLLDNILKTNQKYYESNNELINRLLIANGLLADKIDAAGKGVGAGRAGAGGNGNGDITPQDPDAGGGGLLGGLGWLLGGAGLWKGWKALRGKTPKIKPPKGDAPKVRAPEFPELKGRKKLFQMFKKGGRAAAIIAGFMAAGLATEWILAYMGADAETQAKMIQDALGYVPDWLENLISDDPELAVLLGINAPMLVRDSLNAVKETPKIVTQTFKGGRAGLKGSTAAIKAGVKATTAIKDTYKAYAASRNTVKAIPGGASIAQEILDKGLRGTGRKTAAKTAAKVVVSEAQLAEGVSEMVAKKAAGIGVKKVWGVGMGLAGIMAALRAYQGDFKGAGLEIASGGLSLIPGLGTAGAVGVDAYLLTRDLFDHFYGHYPDETNPEDRRILFEEMMPKVKEYLSKQMSELMGMGVEMMPIEQTKEALRKLVASQPVQDTFSTVPFGDGGSDALSSAIANQTQAQVPVDSSANMGKAQYLQRQQNMGPQTANPTPVPVQRLTPDKINNLNAPATQPPNNVVVNQGDTINNVTNNTSTGGGAAGAAGSPSKAVSPFDQILYGDTFNWGY